MNIRFDGSSGPDWFGAPSHEERRGEPSVVVNDEWKEAMFERRKRSGDGSIVGNSDTGFRTCIDRFDCERGGETKGSIDSGGGQETKEKRCNSHVAMDASFGDVR